MHHPYPSSMELKFTSWKFLCQNIYILLLYGKVLQHMILLCTQSLNWWYLISVVEFGTSIYGHINVYVMDFIFNVVNTFPFIDFSLLPMASSFCISLVIEWIIFVCGDTMIITFLILIADLQCNLLGFTPLFWDWCWFWMNEVDSRS